MKLIGKHQISESRGSWSPSFRRLYLQNVFRRRYTLHSILRSSVSHCFGYS